MEDIEKFITSAMKKCADDNASALAENCEEAGKMAAKMLRQRTRVRTGAYKKGWKADVEQDETGVSCTVHNRTRYQLTHLLEHGHALRNGGRVEGKPHIQPAEEAGKKKLVESLKEKVRNES